MCHVTTFLSMKIALSDRENFQHLEIFGWNPFFFKNKREPKFEEVYFLTFSDSCKLNMF